MAHVSDQGIGLADAIAMLRSDVLKAHAAATGKGLQLPVKSMALELKVAATKSADGKAGFCVPFVNVELGGSAGWQQETLQTLTVTFGAPIDDKGDPVKVSSSAETLKG